MNYFHLIEYSFSVKHHLILYSKLFIIKAETNI